MASGIHTGHTNLEHKIKKAHVIWDSEVYTFCNVYLKSATALQVTDQKKLYSLNVKKNLPKI
ncbi:hypothetical protein ACVWYN_001029 [Pedobacter sp. UYP24]